MRVRFLTSHRSRAWCVRFAVGEEVDIANPALLDECLGAGVAELVAPPADPQPTPLPANVSEDDDADPVPADDPV